MRKAWECVWTGFCEVFVAVGALLLAYVGYQFRLEGGTPEAYGALPFGLGFAALLAMLAAFGNRNRFRWVGALCVIGLVVLGYFLTTLWEGAGALSMRGWLLVHFGATGVIMLAGLMYGVSRLGRLEKPEDADGRGSD